MLARLCFFYLYLGGAGALLGLFSAAILLTFTLGIYFAAVAPTWAALSHLVFPLSLPEGAKMQVWWTARARRYWLWSSVSLFALLSLLSLLIILGTVISLLGWERASEYLSLGFALWLLALALRMLWETCSGRSSYFFAFLPLVLLLMQRFRDDTLHLLEPYALASGLIALLAVVVCLVYVPLNITRRSAKEIP